MAPNGKKLAVGSFVFAAVFCPARAQRSGAGGGGLRGAGAGGINSGPTYTQPNVQPNIMQPSMQPLIPNTPLPKQEMVEDEACLPWSLPSIRGATVSVARLGVPDKARSEYD